MNKLMIHMMIYCISIISYFYLNDINNPIAMLNLLVKIICCNRNITDKDMVYEPENVSVPFEDVKRVGNAVENVIEDVLEPNAKSVKDITKLFEKMK